MRPARYFHSLFISIAVAAFTSSAAMVITGYATNRVVDNHAGLLQEVTLRFLFSIVGAIIAVPICAPVAVIMSLLLILSQRISVLNQGYRRPLTAALLGAVPGFYFGQGIGSRVCNVVAPWEHPHCNLGFLVAVISFTMCGILSALAFMSVYTSAQRANGTSSA